MSTPTPRDIAALLSRDPLADAERITGLSYKDDKLTAELGFAMHLQLAETKAKALKCAHDSHLRMDLFETLAHFASMGFTEILCDEFMGRTYDSAPAPRETFRILWHRDGLLATVESYQGTDRNSSKVYYNLAVTDRTELFSRTSSGHLADGVWVGDHDAREGIRSNLDRLREVGDFLPTWVERPWLWLVAYSEPSGDYETINAERISRLPADVRAAISGVTP